MTYENSYFREILLLYVAIPVLSCLMVAMHHYTTNAGAIFQKLALGVFCGFLTAPIAFGVRFLVLRRRATGPALPRRCW